ncbi:MAG: HAD-IB family hydrolase [Chromatiales bacterium]|nr:HAD-IB family hydrolase [Chromatiales bacterium]
MPLAIFDLDETLISGDCSSLFCEYLYSIGSVESADFLEREQLLMAAYSEQRLAIEEYIAFMVEPLSALSASQVDALMPAFLDDWVYDRLYPQALSLLDEHRRAGDRLLIISASADFIVRAVANHLVIDEVLAIDMAIDDTGGYSGAISGVPSYREGKVLRLRQWAEQQGESLAGAHFYSDSINDRPLMELVDYPVATNPDAALAELAEKRGWPVLDWRQHDGADQATANLLFLEPKTGT